MKIVHFFTSFPNKSQPYNQVLLNRLHTAGVNCEVACLFAKKTTIFKRYVLNHKRHKWVSYFLYYFKYSKFFKKYSSLSKKTFLDDIKLFGKYAPILESKPDLIHIHHIQVLNQPFLNFIKSCGLKTVISVRGSDVLVRPFRNQKESKFLSNVLQHIDFAHTVSENLNTVVESFGKSKNQIFTIYRTVEIEKNTTVVRKNTRSNIIEITTIGRLHWTKGYVDAIKTMNYLKLKKIDFKYNICGAYEINEFDELNFWIKKFNLEKEVVIHNHLDNHELNQILARTSIYLQTSLSEGVPNTLLRAIHFNIPIVTTNAGGIPEIFKQDYGIMVEVGDIKAIASALIKLIQEPLIDNLNIEASIAVNPEIEVNAYKKMYSKLLN